MYGHDFHDLIIEPYFKYSEECLAKTRITPETCLNRNLIHKQPLVKMQTSHSQPQQGQKTSKSSKSFPSELSSPSCHECISQNKTKIAMFLIKCVAQKLDMLVEDRPTPDQFHVFFIFVPFGLKNWPLAIFQLSP